jgi:hypothetical protein
MKKSFVTLISFIFLFLSACNKGTDTPKENAPLPPSDLKATAVSDKQIDLSWLDESTNETGFKIQRKTNTGIFAEVGATGKDITSFSDQGLTPNTSYTYRVLSYNSAGSSVQGAPQLLLWSYSPTHHLCILQL